MGKSSSVTVGHKIFLGGHVVFCHGPIDSIDTIEWDARAGWRGLATGGTITVDAENLFGGSKEASTTPGFGGGDNSDADGVSGEIDILMGEPTQLQNSYLQSVLGELIPAFRGVVSFVLKQLYVGNSPSLRPLAAWGTRIHVKDDGQPQWYDEKAEILKSVSTEFPKYLNISAYNSSPEFNGVELMFGGLEVTGAKATDVLRVTKLTVANGGAYQAWSPWDTDVGHPNPWTNRFYIGVPDGLGDYIFTGYFAGLYPTQAAAEAAVSGEDIILTGYTSYKVGLFDAPWNDNRGGLSFKVELLKKQSDINPAHFLRECYTSTVWGLKLPEYKINDDSFTAAADQLFAEGMGISLLWDRQGPVSELIDEIKRHIDADIYEDNEGLITLKLIRDDYVYDDLDVYDESNIIRIERGASTPERELINTVTVVYWDSETGKDASVQIPHAALVQMQGRINPTTIRYDFFTNADIATKKGEYDLRVMTSSLITYKVVTNRASEEKTIGDRFILNRPDVNAHNMVVRIIDVDLGNGVNNEIIFTVTQEVFSLPAIPVMASSPDATWQDPVQPAVPAPARLLFEQPYYELVQYQGQTEVDALLTADDTLALVGVAAIRPSGTSRDAQVIVDDGAGYHEASVLDYCPSAVLATAMNYTTKNITFTNAIDMDLVSIGTHCQIDEELHVVEALDLDAGTATLGRGVLDTVPAKEHLVGARIWFWDYYSASDSVTYSDGENVDVKILTNSSLGRLATSAAPVDSIEFLGRAARPYPPGKLLINGSAYPATIGATDGLSLAWAHRDRLLQTAGTLQDTTVGDIGPEPGTTYTLRIYTALNALLKTVTAIATNIYNYTTSAEEADMGGVGGGLAIDPYWDKVVLLANMNGTNGSPVFIDSSPNFAIPNGNVHVTTSQLLFGTSVATFDGTGDYLNLPYVPNYDIGSANCTIEYWFRPVSVSVGQVHFDWRDAAAAKGVVIYQSSANPNKLTASVGDSNTAAYEVSITGTTTLVVGTLYHARLVKNGTNWQLYLNGATQGSATSSVVPYLNSAAIYFGVARDGINGFNGQGADLRITKAARNTTGFTAPVSRLGKYVRAANHSDFKVLLTFDGVDGATETGDASDLELTVSLFGNSKISTTQSKFGGSSLELDGSFATFASVAFNVSHTGSGADLTVDFFFFSSNPSTAGVFASTEQFTSSLDNAGWKIGITDTNRLYAQGFDEDGALAFQIYPTTTVSATTWYHVALVRSGTTWTLYLDGSSIGSTTELAVLAFGGTDLNIGRSPWDFVYFIGYIDEFRIRAFAATITVPTESQYPIDPYWSDVVVLMPMSGANNSTQFENIAEITKLLTASGNAQISTAQSKFGGASGLFDGTGDYVTAPYAPLHSAASGDITIEDFLYPTALGALRTIVSKRPDGGSTEYTFGINATGQLGLTAWSSGGTAVLVLLSTDTLAVNQWSHVAASLSGTTWRLFINGQPAASGTATGAIGTNTTGLKIGREHSSNPREWLGYQDGLRITRACRYIDPFTPPSLEFGKYVPALNSQLRFELESVRDGLISYQKHNVIVVRA